MIARIATPGDPAHQWQRFASITQALEWGRVMGVGFLTFSTLTERQAARVRNPDGTLAYPRTPLVVRRCLVCTRVLPPQTGPGPKQKTCDEVCHRYGAAIRVVNELQGVVEMRQAEEEGR